MRRKDLKMLTCEVLQRVAGMGVTSRRNYLTLGILIIAEVRVCTLQSGSCPVSHKLSFLLMSCNFFVSQSSAAVQGKNNVK